MSWLRINRRLQIFHFPKERYKRWICLNFLTTCIIIISILCSNLGNLLWLLWKYVLISFSVNKNHFYVVTRKMTGIEIFGPNTSNITETRFCFHVWNIHNYTMILVHHNLQQLFIWARLLDLINFVKKLMGCLPMEF